MDGKELILRHDSRSQFVTSSEIEAFFCQALCFYRTKGSALSYHKKQYGRYLIIDKSELYTKGASLKDLGKKCFSFMLMNDNDLISELLNRIK